MPTFEPQIPIAAITDEFSPVLAEAIPVMQEIGMAAAELRVVDGKNVMDLTPDELAHTREALAAAGISVLSIASPLLKCILPHAPALDSRFQHDAFGSRHTFEDQPRLTEHAIKIAHFFGAKIIRVFSYWRTVEPGRTRQAVAEALTNLARIGEAEKIIIGLENEHACNVGTASEAAVALQDVQSDYLQLVWDPANCLVAGEKPFPEGYALLPPQRIIHVHAKDCHMDGHTPIWGPLGTRHVPWKKQIRALRNDNYPGYISLETHWTGPNGNKLEASRICGWNLKGLAAG
jgi:sugar phosphate isomerase/epimerase